VQQWFLPVGLVLAMALALVAPLPGSALNETGLVLGLIPLIFLVNGYQTRLDRLSLRKRFVGVLLTGVVIGLLLSPFIGLGTAALLGLPASAALGLVVMASMPPTLSSGVIMTENAGGQTLWAMLLTILLNLIGIFTIPFVLSLTLETGAEVVVSPWPLLLRLLLVVLLPFVLGGLLRRILSRSDGMDVDVGFARDAVRADGGRIHDDRGRFAAGARQPARVVCCQWTWLAPGR